MHKERDVEGKNRETWGEVESVKVRGPESALEGVRRGDRGNHGQLGHFYWVERLINNWQHSVWVRKKGRNEGYKAEKAFSLKKEKHRERNIGTRRNSHIGRFFQFTQIMKKNTFSYLATQIILINPGSEISVSWDVNFYPNTMEVNGASFVILKALKKSNISLWNITQWRPSQHRM